MKFGETLKKIRKENDDSLYTLAEKLGVSHSYIDRIERGGTISDKLFIKILEIYPSKEDELNLAYLEKTVPDYLLDKLVYKNDKLTYSAPVSKSYNFRTYKFKASRDGALLSKFEMRELLVPMGLVFKKNSFCVEIQGDELEPKFYDEDILLVEETKESWQELNKKIVVVKIGDESLVKKVEIIDYIPTLFALNNIYQPIQVDENIKLMGKITNLLNRNLEKIKF